MPGVRREQLLKILERYASTFPHLLMIPDLFGIASLWVGTQDLGGILGLEIRQRLLLPGPRMTKALLDIVLTLSLGLLLLPLVGGIALFYPARFPRTCFLRSETSGPGWPFLYRLEVSLHGGKCR